MIKASPLNTLEYEPALCSGCGMCVEVCPHAVFAMKGRVAVYAHPDACMECGACQRNCPARVIRVESGVGCASAMIQAALTGRKEVKCSCG
jgi:NAD-dependent dihydropyrimidine dehydrogenase PreA subunit